MSQVLAIKMTSVEAGLCKTAMGGEPGEVLLDVITDQIVLSDSLSAEEKAGAGRVLKFLRSLHNDSGNLIERKKEEES